MNGEVGTHTSDSDVPFQQSFTSDDKLQVCGNRLPGYEKPSITIFVIISSWPRPHSNQVINTHIILLKEIEKCISDCQRKEFPMIYTKMFLEHFFPRHPSSRNTKDKYLMIPEVLSGQHLEMILRIEMCCHFSPQGSTVSMCNKHNTPEDWRGREHANHCGRRQQKEGIFAHTSPIPIFHSPSSPSSQ